ncbi:conserved hypothetical protein [Paecilomyces variotii No. 5]|uniref:NACHT domain-containing protein n=1 Tax=Byssochlamys spectabilis (strain No. 5 / NBRC 109023) TaxID=1356009 RepID=V5GDN3_BYSSN|nr:conserved hypothetical protein [Paecilomyces variotii No. 5]
MRPQNRNGFEIAIVCALTLEADTVESLLDERYDKFGQVYGKQLGDPNAYITGRIGQHHVVICILPGMGKASAASAAASLRFSYTRIQLALVVGICGGFPSRDADIRLGDIIISDSVIQYDLGRQYPDGFQRKCDVKDILGRPSQEIRALLNGLKGHTTRQELQNRTYHHLRTVQLKLGRKWKYPGIEHDARSADLNCHGYYLRDAEVKCICFECNSGSDSISDDTLEAVKPCIYTGTIASADTVMKSGEHRNQIAQEEGVLGFEMEGAGVWDNFPCIIIKGVCDYADVQKNKIWQDYAAATAASGAKAFLEYWPRHSEPLSFISRSPRSKMPDHLRHYYTTAGRLHIQRISGELLPMDQCYINLAIVEHIAKTDSARQSSPFSLFERLKVRTVSQEKQVSLPRLFEPRKRSDGTSITPKRILVQGRAGIGKTTLCKKIVNDFLRHELWEQLFDLLLWIPLRRLKGKAHAEYTLVNVFHHIYFPELEDGRDLARDLWETVQDPIQKTRTLFVLDGLDEISQEWDPETPMRNILVRLLDHPQVIITSRPYGLNLGRLESFDLELETVGFNVDQVEAYIANTVKHDLIKADGILAFVRSHTLIQGLVRIPVQLDALCYSWGRSFMPGSESKTMTTLYQAITLKLWQKDVLQLEPGDLKGLTEYKIQHLPDSEITKLMSDERELLESIAFIGLCNDIIEFSDTDRHRVYDCLKQQRSRLPCEADTTLKRSSFLHTSDKEVIEQDRSYHFLHLTFQEFFAACYFEFLQQNKYNSRYDILWRFTAGLLQVDEGSVQAFLQELEAEPRDLLGPVHQRLLMHCLSEVIPDQEGALNCRAKIEEHLSQWLQFECDYLQSIWLGRESECPDHLLEGLLHRPQGVKREVLGDLRTRQNMSARLLETLAQLLKDNDWKVRYEAAAALGQQSALPTAILETLAQLLKDNNSIVRYEAAAALGQQSVLPTVILETLAQLLKDNNWKVRYKATATLGQQSTLPIAILETLAQLLKDNNWKVRYEAAAALGQQSALPPAILETLAQLLKDDDSIIRSNIIAGLGQQSALPTAILETLAQLLKDNDSIVRSDAAAALGRQSALPPAILETLAQLLKDNDLIVRIEAAAALGQQSALPIAYPETLAQLLKDDNLTVRIEAATTLGQSSALPPAILETLAQLLKDNDLIVRIEAAAALGQQSALPIAYPETLAQLLKDDNLTLFLKH